MVAARSCSRTLTPAAPKLASGRTPTLSGHAHNYQRLTRTLNGMDIPYIVAGSGGHGLSKMRAIKGSSIRTPLVIDPTLTLESYDDTDYGYLRIVADATMLRIEFPPGV